MAPRPLPNSSERRDAAFAPQRIAVLRPSGLGDLMFAMPALQALRETFPSAEIVYLGKNWHREFAQGRPGPIDRVEIVPPTPGVGTDPSLEGDAAWQEAFFAAMQEERFDLAAQMHGGGHYSNPFLLRLGAGLTIGLRDLDAPPLDRDVPYCYWFNETLRLLEVVALVGATTSNIAAKVEVLASDLREANAIIPRDERPLVAMHPGSTDPRRRWPPERFAAVADVLSDAGCHVVLTGTEGERDLAAAVQSRAQCALSDTTGRLSIGGLIGLLARARLVVSNDSGPLHLASAVGIPTAGIYWCGNLINGDQMKRATNRPLLSWRLTCPVCGRNALHGRCEHNECFVDDVSVEDVLQEAFALLAAAGAG